MLEYITQSTNFVGLGAIGIVGAAVKGYCDAKSISIDNKVIENSLLLGPIALGGLCGAYLGFCAGISDEDNGNVERLASAGVGGISGAAIGTGCVIFGYGLGGLLAKII